MARLDELEEKITTLERTRTRSIVDINNAKSSSIRFYASSYVADIDITIMSNKPVTVDVILNGVTRRYDTNFISERVSVNAVNDLVVNVVSEGLLSKKIRIEGIGVKLQSV